MTEPSISSYPTQTSLHNEYTVTERNSEQPAVPGQSHVILSCGKRLTNEIERFNIIDPNSAVDQRARETVKKDLDPQQWRPWLYDKIMNRCIRTFFGLLNNKQRHRNRMNDLLANPPQNITNDIKLLAEANEHVTQFGGIPITLEHVAEHAQALTVGHYFVPKSSQDPGAIEKIPMNDPELFVPTSFMNALKLFESVQAGERPNSCYLAAARRVQGWYKVLQAKVKNSTDAEFRAFLEFAIGRLVAKGDDKQREMTQKFVLSAWIYGNKEGMGQTKFLDETAQEFKDECFNLCCPRYEQYSELFNKLRLKLETRAAKICEIMQQPRSEQQISKKLVKQLYQRTDFKQSYDFMQTQISFTESYTTSQSPAPRPLMSRRHQSRGAHSMSIIPQTLSVSELNSHPSSQNTLLRCCENVPLFTHVPAVAAVINPVALSPIDL